jgi:hypothetical protein
MLKALSRDFWTYAVAEGIADLSPVAGDPDDATVEELIGLYRAVQDEHPDWADYRAAMVRDRRLVVRVRVERVYLTHPTTGHRRPLPDSRRERAG